MGEPTNGAEKLTGVAKEAAGKALQDDQLQTEGKADQVKSDVTKAIDEAKDVAADTAQDVKQTISNTADDLAAKADSVNGKGVAFGIGAAALAVGAVWIAYRVAKASAKRHPAVRVARSAVHAVRER
ncbi:CsbD family protein [Mycolicibacterium sp. BiH015]|uniref:CsbD family protein n=1 Tax=Mycolicibacterium sp. BiH015 TaxID=3018808 RepID=UPI002FD9F229